jgi:ATP-dependent DNA helicase RecG
MLNKIFFGESRSIEYKQIYTKTILKTVSAYANYHDGIIIFGIDDNGDVVGIDKTNEVRLSIENAINDNIEPKPFFEIENLVYEGKELILLKIYKGDYTPYTFNQKAYKRMDTSTVQVDRYAYEELILQGRNSGYEEINSKVQNLSFSYLENKLKQKLKISHLSEDLIITLKLKILGKYNNAALLFSDNNTLESSNIQLIAYKDNSVVEIKDRYILEGISVLEQFDKCIDFFNKHINIGEVIEGPYRETVEEIPIVAYREAVANLIVRRDYMRKSPARIEFFSDRIEILSPGGLPIGISEEEYIQGRISVSRNGILADIFLRLKIIEKLVTGIRRIKEYYKESNVKPQFLISENSILVILPKIKPEAFIVKENESERFDILKDKEKEIYELVLREGYLNRVEIQKKINLGKSQTIELINSLINKHFLLKTGQGKATKYSRTKNL